MIYPYPANVEKMVSS